MKEIEVATISPAQAAQPQVRGFKAWISRVGLNLKRFTGTPLEEARRIMGKQFHDLPLSVIHLDLAKGFEEKYPHLEHVPYSRSELAWALRNGFVLTPFLKSMRHMAEHAKEEIGVANSLWDFCNDARTRSPQHPQWWLVQRSGISETDYTSFPRKKSERTKRFVTATAPIALSAALLDFRIYETRLQETRCTASELIPAAGEATLRLAVLKPPLPGGKQKPINVITSRDPARLRPVMAIKPHRVSHPELY